MSVRELREKMGRAASRIREMADKINAEKRDFTASERAEWERVNRDYDGAKAQADRLARAEDVEREAGRRVGDPLVGREDSEGRQAADEAEALKAWLCRLHDRPVSERGALACQRLGMSPDAKAWDLSLSRGSYRNLQRAQREQRALSVVTTTAGAYTIPEGFVYNLEMALLQYGGVRQVADVMRTESGNPMPWPTVNDTSNTGELLAENTTIGSSVDPTFGVATMLAYKYSSKLVLVPTELTEDSAFNIAQEVGKMLGERIGRIQNAHFTTGTNSSQPQGIVTAATLGKTGASATAIAADELFDLQHSVDPAYRQDPSCGFMMHDNVLLAVRKLKDSQNRYLWEPSIQLGVPDRLLNYPVTVNQQMASTIATTQKTILFGAFGKYKVRDVKDVRLVKLVERYADADQVGFVAFLRSDGRLLNAGTNPVKYYAQL